MTYIQPLFPSLLLLLLIASFRIRPALTRSLVAASAVALFLCSWPPIAFLLLLPFESAYEMHAPADKNVEAIVVLSSAWFPPYPPLPTPILGTDTYERCAYAAWLHNHWNSVPVLATGGGSRGYEPCTL